MANLPISHRLVDSSDMQDTLRLIKCSGSLASESPGPPKSMYHLFSFASHCGDGMILTARRLVAIQRISQRCWLIGILLSIGSSASSLVKLRADGRRFALTQAAARKENTEKSPEEKVRAEEERREKGRALLA